MTQFLETSQANTRKALQNTRNFPSTKKRAASELLKDQNSHTGSRFSRLSEHRRLESRAKLLEQKSRMSIEKKEENWD